MCCVCNPTHLPPQEGEQVGAPSLRARWLHIDKSIRLHLITGGPGLQTWPPPPPPPWGGPLLHLPLCLNHPPTPQESIAMGKEGEEAEEKKKIKQRGWQHMNHLASIWMTSMLMQGGPESRQELDSASALETFASSVGADLPCVEEPSVS